MKKDKENLISSERRGKGLASLSSGLMPLVKKLLGNKGLADINILANWDSIVGPELASYSLPQKIEFKANCRTNGVLHLMTASGAFALEIQHKTPLILEKINTFFGYPAVAKIKIIQNDSFSLPKNPTKLDDKDEKKLVTKEEQNYINSVTQDIQNPELKARLQSLGESIMQKNK